MKKLSTFVLILLLCSVWITILNVDNVKAEPKTIVVPDDYVSIQEAIDYASEGDTVFVKSGLYHENLVINKSLFLIGENVDTTIIDGAPSEGYRIPISIQSDNVSISGFKLLYGYTGISMGSVNNCSISGNRIAGGKHGITLGGSSKNNNITENFFESIGLSSAIRLEGAYHNFVYKNYIRWCTEGIQIIGSHNNTIVENTIEDCDEQGIRLQFSNLNWIIGNSISTSGTGVSIYASNNNTVYRNNFIYNSIQFSTSEWYALTFGYNISVNCINENYWSDYIGTDNNGDGIGDTSYIIDENNQDNHPLMNPVKIDFIPEFPSWIILPFFTVATLVVIIGKNKIRKKGLE